LRVDFKPGKWVSFRPKGEISIMMIYSKSSGGFLALLGMTLSFSGLIYP
jgi:hypothetical protein